MPAKKRIRSKAKTQKQISLVASRKIRAARMQEIWLSVSEKPGALRRSRYGCLTPFWNGSTLRLLRH